MIRALLRRLTVSPSPSPAATQDPDGDPSDAALLAWPFTTDAPALGDRLARNTAVVTMLVDLTGLDWPQIEPLLPLITGMAAEKDMVPVLVVDLAEIVAVRRSGLTYDVLPNAAANSFLTQDQDWHAYVAHCRYLLDQKWRPGAIVHLGTRAEW